MITFLPIQPTDEMSFTCPASYLEYIAAEWDASKRRADLATVEDETPADRTTRLVLVNQAEQLIIKAIAAAQMAREDAE